MPFTTRRRSLWIAAGLALAALAVIAVMRRSATTGPAGESGAPPVGEAGHPQPGPLYHCPMHPRMVADSPRDCPVCGMRMVSTENEPVDGTSAPAGTGRKKTIYRSTMNPGEISDSPGKDSMGMEMEPVEVEAERPDASGVDGLAAVRISSRKQQLIGVRTETVRKTPFVRTIQAVGLVAADERRLHHVHAKVDGWIETLFVNATGELVRKGQPLLTLYSPELLATQEEYLLAMKTRTRLAGGVLTDAAARMDALVESSRRRLQLFDFTPAQIDELERTGVPSRTVTLYAQIAGFVTRRGVTQGERIDPNTTLLDIADLSRVWVLASVYETDLPFVHIGQTAVVSLTYLPGRTYEGKVTLVYPVVEAATRTIQVRVELANSDLALKPDMYAQVDLRGDMGERLNVPESAVLAAGDRNIVFVAQGDGYFEPREVRLGVRLPDRIEVLDGLAEGETIVTSGGFLIDSESKLKAALEATAAAPKGAGDR